MTALAMTRVGIAALSNASRYPSRSEQLYRLLALRVGIGCALVLSGLKMY